MLHFPNFLGPIFFFSKLLVHLLFYEKNYESSRWMLSENFFLLENNTSNTLGRNIIIFLRRGNYMSLGTKTRVLYVRVQRQ